MNEYITYIPFHPPFIFPSPNPVRRSGKLTIRIYGSQNAPRGSIFQLPPTFPMTQNALPPLGLDAPAYNSMDLSSAGLAIKQTMQMP